ncbi:serine hydrolase domain-containing protein [Dyadobacter arcticus]|uniref:CubicO group peptidase (Beta-lactamase class C family) n=1 Tax=Dyadobacter arcticus TaxID=1078754 RepID=A0ABX0UQI4_9BACT|nr:serine hydrolase domain-containing protein [Dyadobacter arcticus]NIJ55222.1 CubicO group peptidase (beta-lactamase class C family) [Dyadobacter arcticus]
MKFLPNLLLFMSIAFCATAQSFPEGKQLTQTLDRLLAAKFKNNSVGCAMLVSKKGEVIYKKAFGMADLELNVPMTTAHVFRIASLTKQFTAVAILHLAEKGLLDLKDDIKKYVPDYPTNGQTVTIANLLSHTSGIKNYTEIEHPDVDLGKKDNKPADIIAIFKNQPFDFSPGTGYHYSNSGYILLGFIIEKMSQKSYAEYLTENIFKPLGMDHAFFDYPLTIVKNRVKGYSGMSDTTVSNAEYLNASATYSAGALMMTVDDLFKWQKGLIENKILKPETFKQAVTPFTLSNGEKTNYGFGFGLQPLADGQAWQHSGNINGFSSFEIYLPTEDVYVTMLSNGSDKNTMTPSLFAASLAAQKANVKDISVSAQEMGKYVGMYGFAEGGSPTKLEIYNKDGKLYLKDSRMPDAWQMHFTSSGQFICYEVFPNNHVFTKDTSGKVDGFEIQIEDMRALVRKIR